MTGGDVGNQATVVIRHRRPDDAYRLAALYIVCLSVKPSFSAISDQIGIQVDCQRKSLHALGWISAFEHEDRRGDIGQPKGRAGMNGAERIEPSPRQAAGNLHRKDKAPIFSSLAFSAASSGECARCSGSIIQLEWAFRRPPDRVCLR